VAVLSSRAFCDHRLTLPNRIASGAIRAETCTFIFLMGMPMNTENYRKFIGKKVRITTTEGEVVISKLLSVDSEHKDLIHDLISTNAPERYHKMGKPDAKGLYALPFEFIASIEISDASEDLVD
jgi:hypothetical protein